MEDKAQKQGQGGKLSRRGFVGAGNTSPSGKLNIAGVGGMGQSNIGKCADAGENMRMTNDEEANGFVKPNYREGWSL